MCHISKVANSQERKTWYEAQHRRVFFKFEAHSSIFSIGASPFSTFSHSTTQYQLATTMYRGTLVTSFVFAAITCLLAPTFAQRYHLGEYTCRFSNLHCYPSAFFQYVGMGKKCIVRPIVLAMGVVDRLRYGGSG